VVHWRGICIKSSQQLLTTVSLSFIGSLFKCGDFGSGNAFTFTGGILPAIRLTCRKVCILAWSLVSSLGDAAAIDAIARLIRPDWIDTVAPRTLITINDLDRCAASTTSYLAVNGEEYAATVAPRSRGQRVSADKELVIVAITTLVEQVKTLFSH
jgi:hypothetical protein